MATFSSVSGNLRQSQPVLSTVPLAMGNKGASIPLKPKKSKVVVTKSYLKPEQPESSKPASLRASSKK